MQTVQFSGYQVTASIYESAHSLIYRAIRELDQQSVILKILKEASSTPAELTRYRQEYEIIQKLETAGVIKAYALERYQTTLAIVLEDFGGESLKSLQARQPLNIQEFLKVAIQATHILGEIHSNNIIHKDINPYNIVFNSKTGQLKIIDFGISTQITQENPNFKNPNLLEGTLAYISPEQTGRTSRSVDYRTDFYSLGATFFELLTNRIPFESDDPMELVHCHLAKRPVPPDEINSEVPSIISDIVLKLLAKNAEDRYQSAWGLKVDLETCLEEFQQFSQIRLFSLGQHDYSNKLQIPQKLYGRESEITSLLSAFQRVSEVSQESSSTQEVKGLKSTVEMMLVSGYSGIGKSSLVREIYKPITEKRGYFITGKFDQFQRNIPYSAIAAAFRDLVRQIVTESEVQLQHWREKLLEAFGQNGQVLVDVIPEVEWIVGKQPKLPELGPTESQNRFNLIFQKFIQVFCAPEHPLVIFLDDLQWSDSASLRLIRLMMTDVDIQHLFLICAYRDNEVTPTHPLTQTLNELREDKTVINQITLTPLQLEHIEKLILETIHCDTRRAFPLAQLVSQKTGGNPFFVNEFIKQLNNDGLLSFNSKSRIWQWDIDQIERADITDNVVELMLGKLKKLPETTQTLLSMAACIGSDFDLSTLSIVSEQTPTKVFQEFMPAIQFGLILTTSGLDEQLLIQEYKFLHDRVQQAAYSLIDEDDKEIFHLKIGQLLLANTPQELWEEKIFSIVDHLNLGQKLITNQQEHLKLAQLNLEAGKKAKAASAYAAANQYLAAGLENLDSQSWQTDYQLALTLYQEQAQTEYLLGNFEKSRFLIEEILKESSSLLDKVETYNLLIVQYTLQMKYKEAIQVGRKALKLLDIYVPDESVDDLQAGFDQEYEKAKQALGDRPIASLVDQPDIALPEKKLAVKILSNLGSTAYRYNRKLWDILTTISFNLFLEYGNVPEACYGYSGYGVLLGSTFENYKSGYETALVALKLSEKYNNLTQKARVCFLLANFVQSWVKHVKFADEINLLCVEAGLESGEFQYVGYTLSYRITSLFFQGKNLEDLLIEIENAFSFCSKAKNQWSIDVLTGYELNVLSLIAEAEPTSLRDRPPTSKDQYIQSCESNKNFSALCRYYILQCMLAYLLRKPDEALVFANLAEEKISYIFGVVSVAEHNFYQSLTLIQLYPEASTDLQQQYQKTIEKNQEQLKIWSDNCPENFLHKYLLVKAEIARLNKQVLEAIDLYEASIKSAHEFNFIHNEALASELAAYFWLEQGKDDFTKLYLKQAYRSYQLWGAKQKVADLEDRYPDLRSSSSAETTGRKAIQTHSTNHGESSLDLATLLKASQTISGEIRLDQLLIKLMQVLIENAGAQVGYLILETDGQLLIEASSDIDQQNIQVLQSTPIEGNLPSSIINYVARAKESIVLHQAATEGDFTQDPYIQHHQSQSILCTPLLNQGKLSGILYLENNRATGAFTSDRIEVLTLLSAQAAISLENAQLYNTLEQKVIERTQELAQSNQELAKKNQLIRKIFGRYLSDEVVTTLLEGPSGLRLGGERRKITILTSDLRGFTAIAERLPSEEVIKILNFYLEFMADVITHYEGTIDEFMGDGILTLFGAPTARADDPQRAVACAIAMQLAMKPVNEKMEQWGLPPLEMGIGIHTGEVVVGNIGSEKRAKYGVVGSNVNLTYRIESCSVGGQVLISTAVFDEVGEIVQIAGQQQVHMKGVRKPITIYEVSGIGGAFNLFLSQEEEAFVALPEAIPIQYVALDGKQVSDRFLKGNIIQLSAKAALVQCEASELDIIPAPLTNLKLNLMAATVTSDSNEDVYAKVLEKTAAPNYFYIHFTSSSPNIKARLTALYQQLV